MDYEQIIVEHRNGGAWVTLNRPEAMNSLTKQAMFELDAALAAAEQDPSVRVFVITGAGRAFCAGADLKDMGGRTNQDFATAQRTMLTDVGSILNRLESTSMPTIAAVNGLAVAGGLELVLCCDLVIASDKAKLGDGHANFGVIPGGGGSIRLPRKIGSTRAKYLMFTGEFLSATEMQAAGLVNRVVPADELISATEKLVACIAAKSPLGLRYMKELVATSEQDSLEMGLAAEIEAFTAYADSNDIREGLAAFQEKRKPVFSGT